jgi:hypothetical protein
LVVSFSSADVIEPATMPLITQEHGGLRFIQKI